ncbi:U4/U6-U5 snRNP complex subunit lsm6 [Fusarium musae]|uniref:U6 snRNA-associated Sm-like protein LSm6 n=1 Tax=Fusarium musae TaxID=1042133 RepID=A0A9P8DTW9_9HYPO|nr:U4/U6-U5 snRNP complex subunit lsm6 [Fusarium musae]KAG9507526.1 U4/U6-U5 snRNP complex subunit lsm6 [Fusarium musae]
MENGAISQGEGKDPSSFLSDIIGNPVTVKLNSGVVYKGESSPLAERLTCDDTASRMELTLAGELQSVDGYMNIALEKTAEYVNGQKRREYGDAFVRGNNGECRSVMGRNLANRL